MIRFSDRWVWDFWLAHDGQHHHAFYLWAPRALGDQHLRHRNATIGHSTSTDLVTWEHHGTVLAPRPPVDGGVPGFDASATWTGSVVRAPDGRWLMFYTGSRFTAPEPDHTNVETVGVAVSHDLHTWKAEDGPVTEADPRWYETLGTSTWPEEAWRDPWVHPAPDGSGWHMLTTARALPTAGVDDDDAGVIGHAWSPDLVSWEVRPPLSRPGAGFAHLEVPQVVTVEGRHFLVFSCPAEKLAARRRPRTPGGIWCLPVEDPCGPYDIDSAHLLADERLYSGRVVLDDEGRPHLLAVLNDAPDGSFTGAVSDPLPLHVTPDGRLQLL